MRIMIVVALWVLFLGSTGTRAQITSLQSFDCAPLAGVSGPVVRVTPAQAGELASIVADASSGTTIVLADGTYDLSGGDSVSRLRFRTAGVTLRSESDDATRVTLDGGYDTNELVSISASDVTIAHVTITRAVDHLIHAAPPGDATADLTGVRFYGLRLIDSGEQFLKVNPNLTRSAYVDNGIVACSSFQLTDVGRANVERSPGGCYTGGIDAHGARGWQVRRNYFEGIYCAGEGLAEHAVHFWTGSRDTVVENNVIVDCARGIGFGLVPSGTRRMYSDDPGIGYLDHIDGIIRNNVIYGTHPFYDTGIELHQARGTRAYHNTVVSSDSATGWFASISYRFGNTDVDIRNNLVREIKVRDGASGVVESNLEGVPMSYFRNPAALDFHLTPDALEAIDVGVVLEGAGVDIDGETRELGVPDLGADER